jgi:hypothetical protein
VSVNNSGASLSSATSTGAGSAITFATVCSRHSMAVVTTEFSAPSPGAGANLGAVVSLEVSMDDTNWRSIGSVKIYQNGLAWVDGDREVPALYARGHLISIDTGVSLSVSSTCASE